MMKAPDVTQSFDTAFESALRERFPNVTDQQEKAVLQIAFAQGWQAALRHMEALMERDRSKSQ